MTERTITTEDGKTVREGDRVFNYYDGWWGTLGPIDDGGWADVFGAGKRAYLNGQRIATFDPKGSVDPQAPHPRHKHSQVLTIPAEMWESTGPESDPTARLTGPPLAVMDHLHEAGLAMHVEAWAIDGDATFQSPTPEYEEEYEALRAAVGAQEPFQTLTINDREYIVVITPHC